MTELAVGASGGAKAPLLDRLNIIAGPNFNRWLVPPAALAIHLCIGMAYGFSVFWLPMSKLLTGAKACTGGIMTELTATNCNWTVPNETHIFETFIVMLGVSAAIWGGWLERVGPRKAGFVAACCWGWWFDDRRVCRLNPSALAHVSWQWCHRRYRAGARLHHACVDADQMVP